MAEDINIFCEKYYGVPLTRIENGPLCVNKN